MGLSLLLIVISSLLGVSGQIFLKMGMDRLGTISLSQSAVVLQTAVQIFSSPLVLLGLGCYGLSAIVWLVVLSRVDVSLAYPFLALNFVLVPLFAWLLLGEQIPSWRWFGVGIVLIGVKAPLLTSQCLYSLGFLLVLFLELAGALWLVLGRNYKLFLAFLSLVP